MTVYMCGIGFSTSANPQHELDLLMRAIATAIHQSYPERFQ